MTTKLFPSPSAPVYTPCAAMQRIAALASDANSSPKDWVAVLGSLPDVSHRMLQIINASYSALPSRIASIHQAVVYLGFYTVKTLAMRLALHSAPAVGRSVGPVA
ncbi:MAG: HDOD domain-containing protein [Rhodoferax sp.]|nr:HDOD domain-containing protein [Rhodoferax sp.]